jgi:hypothetical protein
MTDKDITQLVLVLDRSGSMADNGKAVEAEVGVRFFLDAQGALPGQLEVTIISFDDTPDLLALAVPYAEIDRQYLQIDPRGMSAVFDAVGMAIDKVGAELRGRPADARPGRVVVLVATDGLENASLRYTSEMLHQAIDMQASKYGWEFIFMGTSEAAVLQAEAAGFQKGTTYSSSDTAGGIGSAYMAATNAVTRARTQGTKIEVDDEDRALLE